MKTFKEYDGNNTPIDYNLELVDDIASLLHDQWIDWSKGLIKKGEVSQETQDRWNRECFVPYKDLSERMKELDRVFARKMVCLLDTKGYNIK